MHAYGIFDASFSLQSARLELFFFLKLTWNIYVINWSSFIDSFFKVKWRVTVKQNVI